MSTDIRNALSKVVRREAFSKAVRRLRLQGKGVARHDLVTWATLASVLVIAFTIRVQPLKYGIYLYEFDPYMQYRVTQFMLDNGFPAWFSWHDSQVWYPSGRDMTTTTYPGLPLTAASLFLAAKLFGIDVTLWDLTCFFPPIFGALTCLVIYFLGKDIGGRQVGLLSSLFLAICPAYISRTFLGWFDDETVGVLAMVMIFLFYLRALEPQKPEWRSLGYAVAAGLSLGYLAASWGSHRYAIGLLALVTLVFLFVRFSARLTVSYAVTIGVGLFIAILVPREGLAFATEITFLAAIGVLALLLVREFTSVLESKRARLTVGCILFASIAVSGMALLQSGAASSLPTKFFSVLQPLFRTQFPLIESVGEHKAATWASFFNSLGFLAFLAPVCLYFAFHRPTERTLFMAVFFLTTLYFAGSFVRLELLAAPAFSIAAAYVLAQILNPFAEAVRERGASARRRARSERGVDPLFGVVFIAVIFVLTVLPLTYNGIQSADIPASLLSSAVPARTTYNDWIEALTWLRDNAPPDSVVASWWDYGYWITVMANKTTLADNGTLDGKQIATIGLMFLSEEEKAVRILRQYNVSYVLVFVDFREISGYQGYVFPGGYGEENKFLWMIEIAGKEFPDSGLNRSAYLSYDANGQYQGPSERYGQSVIGKLIPYRFVQMYQSQPIYQGPNFYDSEHFTLAFASSSIAKAPTSGWAGGVVIYKVGYQG